uniref:Uncharacterized protein n=1 Tax=Lygus hesperus TaxID=30085 RepID=A0A146LDE2_LYGHE
MLVKLLKSRNCVKVHTNFLVQKRYLAANEGMKKREEFLENSYINRREREILKNLLQKAELRDRASETAVDNALRGLLQKHAVKFTDDLLRDLHEWRHASF